MNVRKGVLDASYKFDEDWLLDTTELGESVADAAVSPGGHLFVLGREPGAVHVFDLKTAAHVRSFGDGVLSSQPHGVSIGRDGLVYVPDLYLHVVHIFSPFGELTGRIGNLGRPSASGADPNSPINDQWRTVRRGAGPFNRPAKVSLSSRGEIFVADGYANARVHRFSADLSLLHSWGEPGTAAGEFSNVHSILAMQDRVIVADREGRRLQIFTTDGQFVDLWNTEGRPSSLTAFADARIAVAELGVKSTRGMGSVAPGVSILSADGELIERFNGFSGGPSFLVPHGLTSSANGDLYVIDLGYFRILKGVRE